MKVFLLHVCLLVATGLSAQDAPVSQLPQGKYQTMLKNNQHQWEKGDIILLDNNHYKLTIESETGEYRFSATSQRVFFTSGPLKGVFAKTLLQRNVPVIVLPYNENQHLTTLAGGSDVLGILKND
jgi:hypothetical protein